MTGQPNTTNKRQLEDDIDGLGTGGAVPWRKYWSWRKLYRHTHRASNCRITQRHRFTHAILEATATDYYLFPGGRLRKAVAYKSDEPCSRGVIANGFGWRRSWRASSTEPGSGSCPGAHPERRKVPVSTPETITHHNPARWARHSGLWQGCKSLQEADRAGFEPAIRF
jgi:hypothetical protein